MADPRSGTATENFLKRWIAFMIGGLVALIVEVVLLPVKARGRLTESLAAALRQINEMETCVAYGIEEGTNLDVYAPEVLLRFEQASGKANGALSAAETFRMSNCRLRLSYINDLTFRQFLFVALNRESRALLRALR